jgi:hypothetical protein
VTGLGLGSRLPVYREVPSESFFFGERFSGGRRTANNSLAKQEIESNRGMTVRTFFKLLDRERRRLAIAVAVQIRYP